MQVDQAHRARHHEADQGAGEALQSVETAGEPVVDETDRRALRRGAARA